MWKGDRVAACVAAASVLAKVTRDRIMVELDGEFPDYGFAVHKGYITAEHSAALTAARALRGAPLLVRERGRRLGPRQPAAPGPPPGGSAPRSTPSR